MVEMLGVLAVVGVLSAVAVLGLRTAMDKHYATQTVNRLKLRAMSVSSQLLLGSTASLSEFNEIDGAYQIPNNLERKDAESFSLFVNDVPKAVCEQIQDLDWKMAKMSDCSDTTLKFKFLNDLSDCSDCTLDGFDCSGYGTECGKCSVVKGYTIDEGPTCEGSENGQYCVRGKCSVCREQYTWANNGCQLCSNLNGVASSNISVDDCHACVDAEDNPTHFIVNMGGSSCFKCTDTAWSMSGYTASLEECKRCSNRCLRRDKGICGIPGVTPQGVVYGTSFVGYALGTEEDDGYCVCAEGYHMENNSCVADS